MGAVLLPHMFCCAYYVLARLLRGLPRLPSPAQMCISLKAEAELKEPVGIPASCFQQLNGTLDNGRALRETLRTGGLKAVQCRKTTKLEPDAIQNCLRHWRIFTFSSDPVQIASSLPTKEKQKQLSSELS